MLPPHPRQVLEAQKEFQIVYVVSTGRYKAFSVLLLEINVPKNTSISQHFFSVISLTFIFFEQPRAGSSRLFPARTQRLSPVRSRAAPPPLFLGAAYGGGSHLQFGES